MDEDDYRGDEYDDDDRPSFNNPRCTECKEPCKVVKCDAGIGSYEFWGFPGFDSRPYWGSDCCEADVEETPEEEENEES